MPATTRAETNRENATHSTGPRTEAGRASSSQNRRTHGFRSSTVLLPGDDPADFNAVLEDLTIAYQPSDMAEERIVREMANAEYRLRAVRGQMESALTRHMATIALRQPDLSGINLQTRAIETLAETGCSYSTWLRYEAKFEHQYDRAQADFWRYLKTTRQLQMNAIKSRRQTINTELDRIMAPLPREIRDNMASNVQPPAATLASNVQDDPARGVEAVPAAASAAGKADLFAGTATHSYRMDGIL